MIFFFFFIYKLNLFASGFAKRTLCCMHEDNVDNPASIMDPDLIRCILNCIISVELRITGKLHCITVISISRSQRQQDTTLLAGFMKQQEDASQGLPACLLSCTSACCLPSPIYITVTAAWSGV